MRRLYVALALLFAISVGCKNGGELVGVNNKRLNNSQVPYGMVYVPAGTFIMGETDQDITFSQTTQNKQVTVQAFYMDETEITNSEYRQFVNWVRDSIAVTDYLQDPQYYLPAREGAPGRYIDWKKVGDGSSIWGRKRGAATANKLQAMYYQGDDKVPGQNEIDVRLLRYHFETMDLREAARHRADPSKRRSDFVLRDTVPVYPDTLVWLADFAYAQNDPLTKGYFSHPSFANYPVVGVTWRQARAFTVWRTRLYEGSEQARRVPRLPYELPTEAEFEYAARGGRVGTDYPWGGPYLRDAKGCLLANFKPGRGNYDEDGGATTVHVKSYFPNDFGLYNMAGNVAEWTSSAYDESASAFVHDLNPAFGYEVKPGDQKAMKRKVVKGGSWKDIGYFLQNSARTYEYQDTARSYIGFRCVTRFPGRDIKDKSKNNF